MFICLFYSLFILLSSRFRDEIYHHVLLVEVDVLDFDAVKDLCQLGIFAEGEEDAVVVHEADDVSRNCM